MVAVLKLGPNSVGGENTYFTTVNSATDYRENISKEIISAP